MEQETLKEQQNQLRIAEKERKEALECLAAATAESDQLNTQCEALQAQLDEKNDTLQQMQLRYVRDLCRSAESVLTLLQHAAGQARRACEIHICCSVHLHNHCSVYQPG